MPTDQDHFHHPRSFYQRVDWSHNSFFQNIFWPIVDLQSCVSFKCTVKWIHYTWTHIYSLCCCCSVTHSCPTLWDPWTAAHQASGPSQSPRVCPSSCSLHWWCCPTISSSDTLFSCPQLFPASGTFPISQLFISGDQNPGASASALVLPKSTQGWFPLRLTGLISLLSTGLVRLFVYT